MSHPGDPGTGVRQWKRRQGNIALQVSAGQALCPESGEWVPLGIPFGPKPRLILTHLNREAPLSGSPLVEAGDSLTAFVRRLLGFDPNGQEIRRFKDQFGSLAGATLRLAVLREGGGFQVDTKVISAFDLWFAKDSRQRVLWPQTVRLSEEYFASLQRHAVPWPALKEQFDWHYGRLDHFQQVFRPTLAMVMTQYRGARLELHEGGLTLRHSPPPVKGRFAVASRS